MHGALTTNRSIRLADDHVANRRSLARISCDCSPVANRRSAAKYLIAFVWVACTLSLLDLPHVHGQEGTPELESSAGDVIELRQTDDESQDAITQVAITQDAITQDAITDDERIAFFESRIRPALIEHCHDCHAADSEASGGLLLDSRDGWEAGGDSGESIVPGEPYESLVYRAISYEDPDLQMPPDGKLPEALLADFKKWIRSGAVDPRRGEAPMRAQTGLPVSRAEEHWSYRPVQRFASGSAADDTQPRQTPGIDAFVDQALNEQGLPSLSRASNEVLVRRLYFDLLGLPPTPQEVDDFLIQCHSLGDEEALTQLADRLLSSVHFGEHFARKWMDVARYAESVTLRGFVLPEAWRYRDYLIEAYNSDRPFDQMVREQLAGDLDAERLADSQVLGHTDSDKLVHERQMRSVATAFLAMGNTNLERQDKTQLDMDYIDEQLEVIGRAFLRQTIGCARCHDHKFDPIPTRDYYALAGIFRSAQSMEHDNVSKWIEAPLPLTDAEQSQWDALQAEMQSASEQIENLKARLAELVDLSDSIELTDLAGVVVDGDDATYVGNWRKSTFVKPFVGSDYRVLELGQGQGTATFEPKELKPGEYDVRMSYTAGSSRASALTVKVFSAEGEYATSIDQRKQPTDDRVWIKLGRFRFEDQGQAYVLLSNEKTKGHMIADAVQFLPVDGEVTTAAAVDLTAKVNSADVDLSKDADEAAKTQKRKKLEAELKELEAKHSELSRRYAARPKYLTLRETGSEEDIPIHIRGDVHNLGDIAPRGFLTAVAPRQEQLEIQVPARLQFANWVANDQNTLTARVYANRVWLWLMGSGIVATPNNFGTTGSDPSHPELLDWLAVELMDNAWSTKHLVRLIVASQAYQRASLPDESSRTDPSAEAAAIDPANRFYWRGHRRRLSVESLRDAMLAISGELDDACGGSLIRSKTKADYNYEHQSTRRSIYHPVFRNSLPELYEAFDFADASVSIGQRPRSTVATQALVLMNHPWVSSRAEAYANRLVEEFELTKTWSASTLSGLTASVYRSSLARMPTESENDLVAAFLLAAGNDAKARKERLTQFVHSVFASLDFRYLD